MALGNRPKGSKVGYSIAFVMFAISMSLYQTVLYLGRYTVGSPLIAIVALQSRCT